nr:efflux RND transporter periplasmic adaptor subunit [Lachnospiraceae bacterium]
LGMRVKLSIICQEHKDALVVPENCIQTNANGEPYVEVKNASKTRIHIEVIMKTDYYTEIKGDGLEDGMQLVVPAVEYETYTDEEGGITDALYY